MLADVREVTKNIDISWHQFSIDCEKDVEQGSILPARAGQVAVAYMHMAQQLIANICQLCYIGIIGCFCSRLVSIVYRLVQISG